MKTRQETVVEIQRDWAMRRGCVQAVEVRWRNKAVSLKNASALYPVFYHSSKCS